MEEKVLFDASRYPAYQDRSSEIMAVWKRFTYIAVIGTVFVGFALLYMIIASQLYEWPLLVAIYGLAYLMIVATDLFIIFKMPKIMKKNMQKYPLIVTTNEIKLGMTSIKFGEFDSIVDAEKVVRGVKPGLISIARGKRAIRTMTKTQFGNLSEFIKLIRETHPEIKIDLDEYRF